MTDSMDTPQISRSGRLLKKSAKVKEMEDFDINELDVQGKPRKKTKTMDELDEFDDKRIAPIKIPKISFNVQGGSKKRVSDVPSSIGKQIFKPTLNQSSLKPKPDPRRSIYHDSSDGSKESDSSSGDSSESSSSSFSSSEPSDEEDEGLTEYKTERKSVNSNLQSLSLHQDKVIVEHHQQPRYESPVYMEPSSDMSSDESENAGSDTALVIAEESANYPSKGPKSSPKRRGGKKDPNYAPRQGGGVAVAASASATVAVGGGGGGRKKPVKAADTSPLKKKKPAPKSKPLSAYMIWCSENRKKIAASSGNIGFGNIGKKMGEAWQALPEKEKMAWRRKAKRLALKTTGNVINTASNNTQNSKTAASMSEELVRGVTVCDTGVLGTAPVDAAAHLKLLGDSLTVIGQRLIEHEGQLAVSGIYSVLLDTLLCAIGPLLCLTTEMTGLEHLSPDVFKKTLDHIAYFMPGL